LTNYELRCTDLLAGLARLPAESVDLVITSPPYNIGKEYESPLALADYLKWCERWLAEIYRVTRPEGAFWLNLGYLEVAHKGRAVPIAYLLWDKSPFYLNQEVVWHYEAGVASKKTFSPRNEKWLWYVKNPHAYTFNLDAVRDPAVKYPNQKKNGKLKCNPLGKNPGDVWHIPKVTSGTNRASKERMPHPAQFPVSVVERIILACSNPGELVLDPFAGSGSTLVSAYRCGRSSLGFEIREDYTRMALERLEVVSSQFTS
jgi:adenine-specific DNA-methyltransferase